MSGKKEQMVLIFFLFTLQPSKAKWFVTFISTVFTSRYAAPQTALWGDSNPGQVI